MTRGLMPYRDLFDHKGPLLFILYALGAAISDTSFIGVFALEALSLAAAVYAGWRTVAPVWRRAANAAELCRCWRRSTCCCTAFTQGGSAEEFALPALAVGVYLTLAADDAAGGNRRDGRMLGFGAAAGWVFLIKYTDIGLFAGLGVVPAGVCLAAGGVRPRAGLRRGGCCWARRWSARPWRRIWRSTVRWARASRFISCRTCLITAACR